MSTKLDKPLDEIVSAKRRDSVRRRSLRRSTTGRPAPTAPAGGIQKTAAKNSRGSAAKATPIKAAIPSSDSKVIVSNLVCCPTLSQPSSETVANIAQPKDVTEKQIKVCFR